MLFMIFVLLLFVDIQSTDKVDKDNDLSSDTDDETPLLSGHG